MNSILRDVNTTNARILKGLTLSGIDLQRIGASTQSAAINIREKKIPLA